MSDEKLRFDAHRWWRQAEDDLEAATALLNAGKHAQACFLAQQAGEKGIKALWKLLDLDPWGHSIGRLLKELPAPWRQELSELVSSGLALDKLYIPTRYPDALAELTPAEAFTAEEAEQAIHTAARMLIRIRSILDDA